MLVSEAEGRLYRRDLRVLNVCSGSGTAIAIISNGRLLTSISRLLTARRALGVGARRRRTHLSGRRAAQSRGIPVAHIEGASIGDARGAADQVRNERYRVVMSEVDLLCDLDRIIDIDAEGT
jgi:hypothetical protein